MAALLFVGWLAWLQNLGGQASPGLGKTMLQNTTLLFCVLGCTIFGPKPLLAFSFSRWAVAQQLKALYKKPVLLKPFIRGLLAAFQIWGGDTQKRCYRFFHFPH